LCQRVGTPHDANAVAVLVGVHHVRYIPTELARRENPYYQLDRIFASKAIAGRVCADDVDLVHDGASDHAAVTFSLDF
jgi:hypothetical protein